jgi:1-acyl-sn-glycerol-3-phosphate acyltransferase
LIRLLAVLIVIVPATAWYAARIAWQTRRGRPGAVERCERLARRWAALILRAAGAKVVLENASVIDPDRPQVLVANHVSWFDVVALIVHLPGSWVFVAKKELEKVPLFGAAAGTVGTIFIDRDDRSSAVDSLGSARRSLEERRPTIIMFPEGTRSVTGELQRFKKGAFVLAIQAGAEVVPAAIFGSRHVMRKGSLLIRSGTITVRFGEPIPIEEYDMARRNDLTNVAREAMLALQAASDD